MKRSIHLFMIIFSVFLFQNCSQEDVSSSTSVGSYSTMLTLGSKLYLVNDKQIKTFNIENADKPDLIHSLDLGDNIESLYHYDGLLLVGSNTNMYILEIKESGIPERKSITSYNNIEFCTHDPIVARNDLAYVTLSSVEFVFCNRPNLDELRVYDIKDIERPVLLETIEMARPKGMGLSLKNLYVCDQEDGLVIYDLTNPEKPEWIQTFGGFKAFDVIVRQNKLIVACGDELRQYDISDEKNIVYISSVRL